MKKLICTLLAAAALGGVTLFAQGTVDIRRVELDSLVTVIRALYPGNVYYIKDADEQSSFTVSAPRETFVEAAFNALKEKGYVISSYGTDRFILHSKSVFTSLPAGYFNKGKAEADDSALQQFLAEQSAVVTFQNKVYEIGESNAGRTGKVYVSGHVRDVSSGEPLVGVSVYEEKTGVYALTS